MPTKAGKCSALRSWRPWSWRQPASQDTVRPSRWENEEILHRLVATGLLDLSRAAILDSAHPCAKGGQLAMLLTPTTARR